jgi:uncharacterized protein
MHFEWDPKKARENLMKHHASFDGAVTSFYDPFSATFDNPDHSDEEQRLITIGYSSRSCFLVVSHTDRGENTRIISARAATTHERKNHEKNTGK